ncbi:sensor histidine kinase [Spirillospora sp. NPDC048911]|uniref:sensor histidine kinase n=1 Tax=Spirillospora sp. NPDC048911 TaxID=3364527 RepID=UPI0037138A8D
MDAARRRWAVDAALVVVCLALTVLAVRGRWAPMPSVVIAGAGAAGSLAQLWRRRLPWAAAVAGAAAYLLSGNPGPVIVGLYSSGASMPLRYAWMPTVAGWAGLAGWSWIDEGHLTLGGVAGMALGAALVTAAGVYVATRRALAESWRARAEGAEAERRLRDEQARAAERARIAREMHDVLAHKVSLIALHAGALELTAGGGSAPVRKGAALIRVTAREALQELRYVLGALRTDEASLDEPFSDLASLVGAAVRAGQRVELDDRAGTLPPVMARVVFRVVQEGLTNARKHAPHARATVTVDRVAGGAVSVTVHNDGGAEPADLPGSGTGLVGLAERLRLVGGTLHSGPAGAGWRLRAELPWRADGVPGDAS